MPKVLLLQGSIFMIISLMLLLKSSTTSVFLSEFGVEKLPLAFIIIGFAAVGINAVMQRLYHHEAFISIIRLVHYFNILVFVSVAVLYHLGLLEHYATLALYVYMSLFALLITSLFWQLVNHVYTLREAKRLVAPLGAAAIAGGIAGGYMASLLVGIIGNAGIFLLVAVLLLANVLLQIHIWKKFHLTDRKPESRLRLKSAGKLVRNKHVRNIAIMFGLGVLVAKLVDFQFNDFATRAIDDPVELTAFLGFWLSTFNIASLLIQLTLSNRLIDRLGVSNSLMILPLGIAFSSLLLLISPLLWVAILLKGMDGSLKQSTYKTAYELVIMPLDRLTKVKAKSFVDIMVDSLATGIAGILLLVAITGFEQITTYILLSAAIVTFSILWIYVIYKIKGTYYQAYKKRLMSNLNFGEGVSEDELVLTTEKKLWEPRKFRDQANIDKLVPYLDHVSDKARYLALRRIERISKKRSLDYIKRQLDDPSSLVRNYAFRLYLKYEKDPASLNRLYDKLKFQSRASMLVALARTSTGVRIKKEQYDISGKLEKLISRIEKLDSLKDRSDAVGDLMKAIVLAEEKKYYDKLGFFLSDEIDPTLTKKAIEAAGEGSFNLFGEELFRLYFIDQFREDAAGALSRFRKATVSYVKDHMEEWDVEKLTQIPYLLSRIPLQVSLNLLFEMLNVDKFRVRSAALRAVNEIRVKYDHLNFRNSKTPHVLDREIDLLENLVVIKTRLQSHRKPRREQSAKLYEQLCILVQERIDSALLKIFICLSLEYEEEDVIMAFQNLKGDSLKKKADSLDFLDGILDFKIRKTLLPVLELNAHSRFSKAELEQIGLEPLSLTRSLIYLYRVGDPELSKTVASYVEATGNRKLKRYFTINRLWPTGVISKESVKRALDMRLN